MARFNPIRGFSTTTPSADMRRFRALAALAGAAGLLGVWIALDGMPERPQTVDASLPALAYNGDEPGSIDMNPVNLSSLELSRLPLDLAGLEPVDLNPVKAASHFDIGGAVEWNTNYDAAMLRAGRCPTALDSTHCERHLRPDYVIDPPDVLSLEVQADGADPAVIEAVNGEHVVKPDGDIDLGETLGNFQIGGTTLAESPARIQEFLKARLPDAKVSVSVASQNSKVYYVITEGMDDGDLVARFPLSSDETVRDALRQMSDLDLADKKIWIARPVCDMSGPDEILTVDAVEVMAGEETESNYSLNPGDRIFVTSTRGFWQSVDDVLSGSWISLRKVFDDSADTTVNAFPFPTDEE